jgi:hypothetical protein
MKSFQNGRLFRFLVLVVCLACAHASQARKVQGWESGDPAIAGSVGDTSVQGAFQSQGPPEGSNQYLITTIRSTDGEGLSPISGFNSVPFTTLNSSSNFGGSAPTGNEGSGVFIPFSLQNGTEISMTLTYDFLSNEPAQATPRNDFAFYVIYDNTGAAVGTAHTFVSVTSPNQAFTQTGLTPASPFLAHTGYQTLTISLTGLNVGTNYTLGIGIEDATNAGHNSGLLIDNLQIVPEPSTLALGALGALLMVGIRRRLKRA